jgi:5'-phosphate synthase pdxT subunit
MRVGILALQGGVSEHISATRSAALGLGIACEAVPVRTREQLQGLDGLVIPGGESTTLQKLCERQGMFEELRAVRNIFGTCAGAIMLAKALRNAENGQMTLGLMDIEIGRNAYGRQAESFEEDIDTGLGPMRAVFIRAPRILGAGPGVKPLAKRGTEIVACEQELGGRFYLATCFHPELATAAFHEHFLRRLMQPR